MTELAVLDAAASRGGGAVGDLLAPEVRRTGWVRKRSIAHRLALTCIAVDSGCWIWLGSRKPAGYGQIGGGGQRHYAHRVAYELTIGPVPTGLHLDHLCRNRACVNPVHLEAGPKKVNDLRAEGFCGVNARKTECPAGHVYNAANTLVTRKSHRLCRTCNRNRARARRVTQCLTARGEVWREHGGRRAA